MMILEVPLIRQPKDSVLCGPAALSMIMQYHGKNKTIRQIAADIDVTRSGTDATVLGSYLMRNDFDVELVTLNPYILTVKEIGASQEKVHSHLEGLLGKYKDRKLRRGIREFLEFMDLGGKVDVKIPSRRDVISEISQKRPLISLMTTCFLSGISKPNSHYTVITGYDARKIHVNDPFWDSTGGRQAHDSGHFFYGIYANAFRDVDNASLMKIRPR